MSPGETAAAPVVMTSRHLLSIAACVAVAMWTPSAQTPQQPLFRASTDLIEVDAVVQDKTGRFVAAARDGILRLNWVPTS